MAITKNQKIMIGIGVVALGYYLYTQNKKKNGAANNSTTIVEGEGEEEMSNFVYGNCGNITANDCVNQGFGTVGGGVSCTNCVRCNKTYPSGAPKYTTQTDGSACPSGSAGGQGAGVGKVGKLRPTSRPKPRPMGRRAAPRRAQRAQRIG